jgi:hypothetical protein
MLSLAMTSQNKIEGNACHCFIQWFRPLLAASISSDDLSHLQGAANIQTLA